jgi:4-amino-4-deoxy-L-arabinose transferase-like glycosyltransferase
MGNPEEVLEKRSAKLKIWLKKPTNLLLLAILILGIGIRLYYFSLTIDQTLWWDEAEYGATAKMWAFDVPYELNPQRPPLFQFLWTIFLKLNFSEPLIKLLLVILPSSFMIFAVYLLGKEMYNQKAALIAALLIAVSWTLVFWSVRFQPDSFSLCFQILSILFMWKHWKSDKSNAKYAILAGVFAGVGFYFKVSALLVPLSFFFFVLIKDKHKMFFKKEYYYSGIAFLITLIPYFIWSYLTFGDFFAFRAGYSHDVIVNSPFGWYNLKFYSFMTDPLMFWIFIFGLIYSLRFFLYFDILIKEKNPKPLPNLFSVIVLATVSAFYIFYIRGTDDRWVFLWMPFIFLISADGILFVAKKFLRNYKAVAGIFVILLLGSTSYLQYQHFNGLIFEKKDSYMPVKLAGLWLKEHTDKQTSVSSLSYTQTVYYSERNVSNWGHYKNQSAFEKYIEDADVKYLTYSIFEPLVFDPVFAWMPEFFANNTDRFVPVQAYFADASQQNAILIIYEVKGN